MTEKIKATIKLSNDPQNLSTVTFNGIARTNLAEDRHDEFKYLLEHLDTPLPLISIYFNAGCSVISFVAVAPVEQPDEFLCTVFNTDNDIEFKVVLQ